ncbi:metallophosphoesterase [Acidihalobacter ferrooxydans]|uniref:Serine/threonine specific protein phosphatases domain-containing protein n=1 Tax=Acidihalobacter ferrooxydans TaxID=1765967 RepID=A0A1P8UIG8_9GAMM|nr:metallophosphoesterase [Acidihalobacter ferrooxydans]APZ43635.1 hypothetical protein BW247_11510 [Acidihalobacter ferrooxydans]
MHAAAQPPEYHRFLARNATGRDFCVGDLHGMFHVLDDALDSLGFDPACDRLISVGDLIDRGPESPRVLEFLAQPWFHAVRGNHEAMLLDVVSGDEDEMSWVERGGADWWLMINAQERTAYSDVFSRLPYTLELDTAAGRVGVVHADVPVGYGWGEFVAQLPHDNNLREHALWARLRINSIQRGASTQPVDGLHLLVVGHTPVAAATRVQNIYYIDTGAAYVQDYPEATLTLLQVHPQQVVHRFPAR